MFSWNITSYRFWYFPLQRSLVTYESYCLFPLRRLIKKSFDTWNELRPELAWYKWSPKLGGAWLFITTLMESGLERFISDCCTRNDRWGKGRGTKPGSPTCRRMERQTRRFINSRAQSIFFSLIFIARYSLDGRIDRPHRDLSVLLNIYCFFHIVIDSHWYPLLLILRKKSPHDWGLQKTVLYHGQPTENLCRCLHNCMIH